MTDLEWELWKDKAARYSAFAIIIAVMLFCGFCGYKALTLDSNPPPVKKVK